MGFLGAGNAKELPPAERLGCGAASERLLEHSGMPAASTRVCTGAPADKTRLVLASTGTKRTPTKPREPYTCLRTGKLASASFIACTTLVG